MPPAALEVRDLRKAFGTVNALRGVSFRVERGEVFGYLGPNGAGKTTTLRILLGLVHPSAGDASILGVDAGEPRSRADIGFVPGDLRLYNDMTGHATLDFFARFRPSRPPALRPQLLEALGLDAKTLERRVKLLSHGTRQKLGLVAAMQHDPELLLLDEPTNGLDPLVQHTFRELLADFAKRGRSVFFSSHVLSEVEAACARVAILRQGEIVALETIEKLREKVVRKLTVRLRDDVVVDWTRIPGVTRSDVKGRESVLWLQGGDPGPLLACLASLPVDDLVFPEPQLEDIFLSYYGNA
jgi:ABC-2 type transport system ATP-binding protein